MKLKTPKKKAEKSTTNDGKSNGGSTSNKRIHNVRFYNLAPRSINAMSHNKENKLAIARADGSIEIWDVQHAAFLEKVIPKSPGNSVDSLAWSGQRLFSAGITGELVEWNLQTLRPKHKQLATGNSIWCLDVNPEGTEIAVGTEEGYVNVFEIVENDNFQYKKLFDKHEGRILCCKYDSSGDYLVAGCLGTIRIWNTQTGHFVNKIPMPKIDKNADIIVWSMQILPNLNIIAGDSRGCITVWDGHTGALLESHQALKADVLAVALNDEGNVLICAGVEPTIKMFSKAQIKREDSVLERWVKYLQRSIHDHDIKALLINGDDIYSGGLDGYLGVSSLLRRKSETIRYGPFLKNPCAAVANESNLLLLQYPNYLEVWRLGKAANGAQNGSKNLIASHNKEMSRRDLDLEQEPKKLLTFKRKDEAPIVCATISPNGRFMCYSTLNQMRIFNLKQSSDVSEANAQIVPLKDVSIPFTGASHLQFSADSKRLYLVSRQLRKIYIFNVPDSNKASLEEVDSISLGKHVKDDVVHFAVSNCGNYLVAAGADRAISVWHFESNSKRFAHYLKLPKYSATTTALAIHPKSPRLVVAFSDGKIFEYDLDEMCFSCTANKFFVPSMATHPIWNILLDANNPNIFVLQNDSRLIVVQKQSLNSIEIENGVQAKKGKHAVESENEVAGLQLRSYKSYEHLIYAGWLQESKDMLAISVNPLSIIEQLPAAFKQKKFGLA